MKDLKLIKIDTTSEKIDKNMLKVKTALMKEDLLWLKIYY